MVFGLNIEIGTFGATLPPINLHHASLRDANIIRYLIVCYPRCVPLGHK